MKLRSDLHALAADGVRNDLQTMQISERAAAQRIGLATSTFNAFLNLQNRSAQQRTIAKLMNSDIWSNATRENLKALRDYNTKARINQATEAASSLVSIQKSPPFEAISEALAGSGSKKVRIQSKGVAISYDEWLCLLTSDVRFVDFFISIFKLCGYHSYVWEVMPVDVKSAKSRFEFVIHNSPNPSPTPDTSTYAAYFNTETANEGVVTFDNLGGDALLVVPSPFRSTANYIGLAQFYNDAPIAQQRALWHEISKQVRNRMSDRPLWVSVAGGGINWLHVRLDSTPKYYRYEPYTRAEQ